MIERAPGQPGPQSLTLIVRPRPARPPIPHFYWPTPHFYWPNPSLLLAKPLTSIGQTPHFYQPDPSLLSARPGRAMPDHVGPCRTVSGRVGTVPDRAVPIRAVSPCRPDTGTSLMECRKALECGCLGQLPRYRPSFIDRAGPCRAVSAPCRTVPCQSGPCRRVGLTLAHP